MAEIIVFGAGGRAGRTIAAAAVARGHSVTGVVRDPGRYPDLDVVAGDVTDAAAVARLAAGHDVAVHAAVDLTDPDFFATAAAALATALPDAGVARLLAVGLASNLPTADGVLLRDTPGYPNEYRAFYLGHAAGTDRLRETALEWTVLAPAGDFDHTGEPIGGYRSAAADADLRITYPDFAHAVLDEIEKPGLGRTYTGVTGTIAV
ncbi:NAD(P)-dependent oxidoreductase [Nocardia sp. alder85J]|uniref:NAD(P)-dependent oxidoreductase n=1 Tax=Nocardia sp. alder85J TaxID=2862949 RepID=UPI001CD1B1F0|nr:NAD(P)H-binding protein [Nocardia sp. alder85J]MCX4094236.1 NAD(P)H-binding protein [Nocardia sp. alder85J]